MPGLPSQSDLHVNAPLTNVSVAYIQEAKNFIADKVFPIVPSEKQSDLYYEWNRSDFNRNEVRRRSAGTESSGGAFRLTTNTFTCDPYAIHKDVADMHRDNADSVLDLDRSATKYVTQQLLIQLDSLWASTFFKTGVWTGADLDGVAAAPGASQFLRWDVAGSTPIEDIDTYREAIAEKTGYMPNTLVLGPRVFAALKNHADILDRIKYTERGLVTPDLLASLFEVDQVLVPRAINVTTKEGQATQTSAYIHGKHALLCYSAPSAGIEVPSGGYTFAWTGRYGSGGYGNRVKKFRMEHLEADRVEAEMAVGMKVVGADLGAFFETAVS